ncbi:MAG: DUF92 domain-containing protein [Candidatus Methanofastidiosia archaeon]|jgi:uncharacterized protein (TIGR00297 family)
MISSINEVLVPVVVLGSIGALAWKAKVVRGSGLWSGFLIGFLVWIFTNWKCFVIALTFFVLSGIATKYKYDKKREKGIAEAEKGARGYGNVFGNGLVALVCAVLEGVYGGGFFLAGFLGAMASATADTAGGEIGRLSKTNPVLITTFETVEPGAEGGITVLGEVAEFAIAGLIGFIAWGMRLSHNGFAGVTLFGAVAVAGFVGANVDSVLGATCETHLSWWENNQTNLWSTAAGCVCAMVFYYIVYI